MRIVHASVLSICAVLAACGGANESTNTDKTSASSSSGSSGAGGGSSSSSSSSSSSGGGAGGTLDDGQPSDVYPAPHAPPPIVVSYGGLKLAAPRFVPVFFSNDDPALVAQLKDFQSKIGATQYWAATTAEYGVGPGTSSAPADLIEAAPPVIDDSEIQAWLAAKLNSDDPEVPAPAGDDVYVIFYPDSTAITMQGASSCVEFGGYHNNITLDAAHASRDIAYAVIPRCGTFGSLSGIDAVTAVTTHELVEAATDPYPSVAPAYALMDTKHLYWLRYLGGGEVGDMCSSFASSFTTFPELDYAVQRSWSNKAALAGHDPCVPALAGSVYFNSPPELNDNIKYTYQGQVVTVKGAKIALGETKTIDLTLFSDGDTGGPWTVEVQDLAELFGQPKRLDLTLDRTTGVNGERLHLTITVLKEGMTKTETFRVVSTLGAEKHIWLGVVGST